MKLFIKTPMVKVGNNLSNYPAHLLEHLVCINHDKTLDNYFDYNFFNSSINHQFTIHTFSNQLDISKITKTFMAKIHDRLIQEEIDMIVLEEKSISEDFYPDIIGKKLLGKDFYGTKPIKISYDQIRSYHQVYYQPEKRVITDDDYRILQPSIISKKESDDAFTSFCLKNCIFESKLHHIFYQEVVTAIDYLVLQIIYDLLQSWLLFYYRYVEVIAFEFPNIDRHMSGTIGYILIPHYCMKEIKEITDEFIVDYINRYMEKYNSTETRRIIAEALIVFGHHMTEIEYKQSFRNISQLINQLKIIS